MIDVWWRGFSYPCRSPHPCCRDSIAWNSRLHPVTCRCSTWHIAQTDQTVVSCLWLVHQRDRLVSKLWRVAATDPSKILVHGAISRISHPVIYLINRRSQLEAVLSIILAMMQFFVNNNVSYVSGFPKYIGVMVTLRDKYPRLAVGLCKGHFVVH